ncbi:MAG: helix-turn-helix transcriptional regulator [Akkermansiaceae bacterium]|nr:helix-turn-helix transcriptional regulator [Akkermansiaceae bacterium]
MKGAPLDVKPSRSAIRHRILGTHFVDTPVAGIEVLMHRYVELERWSLRMAANAFWRLYWPLSRGGTIDFEDLRHELEPGCLYLISPHTAFDSHCDRPFAKWYLHFNVGGSRETCRPGIVRLRPDAGMRDALARACPKPGRSPKRVKSPASPLDGLEIALLAYRHALPQLLLPANANLRLPACLEYLRQHLRDKVTLDGLSRFAGVSVRTLSTMFVSGTGFPPMRYLIELRLNHAMKLLRHTGHSIDQIADECGFPNRYYFTRMLAKYRKTTPAAFRASSERESQAV